LYYLHLALVWIFLGFPIPNKDPYLSTLLVCIFIISLWTERVRYEWSPPNKKQHINGRPTGDILGSAVFWLTCTAWALGVRAPWCSTCCGWPFG